MPNTAVPAEGQPKKVFVISPIGAKDDPIRKHADRFLNYIVRAALPEPEFKVERADEDDSAWAITEAMLRSIVEADICVADITGRNPNVMYELALAHATNKRVIIMNSDGKPAPFDIKDQRALSYGFMPEEVADAIRQLHQKATHDVGPTAMTSLMNPVATAFKQWTDLQKLETEKGTPEQAMHRVVERLEAKLDRAINTNSLRSGTTSDAFHPIDIERLRNMAQDMYSRLSALTQEVPGGDDDIEHLLRTGSDIFTRGGTMIEYEAWLAKADTVLRHKQRRDNKKRHYSAG